MILIIKHVLVEGTGLLGINLKKNKIRTKTIELEKGEKLPGTLNGIKAIISMGGPMNVYQEKEYPFLKDEDRLLKNAFDSGVAVLGICLGAQLMAKALGGKISKAPRSEIDWQKLQLSRSAQKDPLFCGIGAEISVFQYHGDMFEVPCGATLLAENSVCPQAFKFADNSYGFQFHPEVTASMLKIWSKNDPHLKNKDVVLGAADWREFKNQAYKMFDNFLSRLAIY